ncbi:MAG: hypothetical protein WDZ76_09890 [Pseudohongiellaceae bacterium]
MNRRLLNQPWLPIAMAALCCQAAAAEAEFDGIGADVESTIKFAFSSPAWGENVDTGIHVFAGNESSQRVILRSIRFLNESNSGMAEPGEEETVIDLGLSIPAGAWAEADLEYVDLLYGNACIEQTLADDGRRWKLVEVSNYTLNPSVRSLIIENAESFRIFSCPRNVQTRWTNTVTGQQFERREWVLYHFESRRQGF